MSLESLKDNIFWLDGGILSSLCEDSIWFFFVFWLSLIIDKYWNAIGFGLHLCIKFNLAALLVFFFSNWYAFYPSNITHFEWKFKLFFSVLFQDVFRKPSSPGAFGRICPSNSQILRSYCAVSFFLFLWQRRFIFHVGLCVLN